MPHSRRSRTPLWLGALFLLLGVALAVAGGWLLSLGGSAYYLVAGLLMAGTGIALIRRSTVAYWLFALLLAGSLAWSLWEVGIDWWPLAARLDVLFVLGLLLATPWIGRGLGRAPDRLTGRAPAAPYPRAAGLTLGGVLLAALAVAVASWVRDPHAIEGHLPPERARVAEVSPDAASVRRANGMPMAARASGSAIRRWSRSRPTTSRS